jgi:uncharacterized protein
MRAKDLINSRALLMAIVLVAFLAPFDLIAGATPALPTWRMKTPWSTETATIQIGDQTIVAEIADTAQLRSRGLGFRDGLRDGTGMLFVYESPSQHTFWMKGMRFCLDIIWIEGGEIRGAAESVCPMDGVSDGDLPRYKSPEPVRYVLEMPAGWMAGHGFSAGEPVSIALPG